MATRYRQNEDGTLRIVAADGAAEGKKAADGAAEGKKPSTGGARRRRGLRCAASVAGLVATYVTLVIGWGDSPLMALGALAFPCLVLFLLMLLYGLHPEEGDEADLDGLLAFAVTWLCLLAAAMVLASDTEGVMTALMVSVVMEFGLVAFSVSS